MAASPGRRTASPPVDTAVLLPHELLAGIVAAVPVGIAVFDAGQVCVYVNENGQRLLDAPGQQEAARVLGDVGGSPGRRGQRWPGLEFREIPAAGSADWRVIVFSPAAPQRWPGRLHGLSRAVADTAVPGSLVETLNAIASEVKSNLHLAAVNILLYGDAGDVLGGAGFSGTPAERSARLRSCDALGAEFKHREALRARRLVVVPHRYAAVMRDPRWAPAHAALDTVKWDGFAAVPLKAGGQVVGTLSAFYPSGLTPAAQVEIERLAAVADQAASAVDSAGLLRRDQASLRSLTRRELEVLGLLAEGCSNQEIARQLAITERTARTHVSNLLGKLHLGSRTQAALLAQQEGLHPLAFPVPR